MSGERVWKVMRRRLNGWLRRNLHDLVGTAYAVPGSGSFHRTPCWPFGYWTASCSECGKRIVCAGDLRWRHAGELW